MDCHETQRLLHAYVDGELDLLTSLEVERHLQACSACAQAHARLEAVRTAVRSGAPAFRPPLGLEDRLRASLAKASPARPASRPLPWLRLALAASVLLAAAGWGLVYLRSQRSTENLIAQELIADHIRSQMVPDHLVDVPSSDQHTVKPWFKGKLDFSPTVPDLAAQGFVLDGGRLDYLNDRPTAVLVYRRRQHVINLFIWRSPGVADAPTRAVTRQTYHLYGWTRTGLTYWAVSDLNERELQEFVHLIQEKTP